MDQQPGQQAAAREPGLEAGKARPADGESREAELEEVSEALLLTESDDPMLSRPSSCVRSSEAGHVCRLPPVGGGPSPNAPLTRGSLLFASELTFGELPRRLEAGAQHVELPPDGGTATDGLTPLFVVTGDGVMRVATAEVPVEATAGATASCPATTPGTTRR